LHHSKIHFWLHGILFSNYNVPIMNEGKGSFSSPDFSPDDLNRIAPNASFMVMKSNYIGGQWKNKRKTIREKGTKRGRGPKK